MTILTLAQDVRDSAKSGKNEPNKRMIEAAVNIKRHQNLPERTRVFKPKFDGDYHGKKENFKKSS